MGELNNLPIIQIVGYKNSGKTTLIQKLIRELGRQNLQFGVLKHHGHGGIPVVNDEGTDTWKFREAGAKFTAIEGEGFFQLAANSQGMLFETMLSFFKLLPLDGIIIEGFKQEDYPKVILVRNEKDLNLLDEVKNIVAIIYWKQDLMKNTETGPAQFFIQEDTSYLQFIVELLEGALK